MTNQIKKLDQNCNLAKAVNELPEHLHPITLIADIPCWGMEKSIHFLTEKICTHFLSSDEFAQMHKDDRIRLTRAYRHLQETMDKVLEFSAIIYPPK